MSAAVEILVIFLLLVANGILAMSEIAVVSARKTRLKNLAERGSSRAKAALRLSVDPGRFLSTVQVGISLVGVLAGAFGGATLSVRIRPYVEAVPGLTPYADGISFTLVVIAITYLSLVIGELVPKQIALRNAEKIAMLVARPMELFARLAHPLVSVLTFSTNALLRIFVKGPSKEPVITEDEVKLIIRQATEAGVVKAAEQDMIYGVLRLGDLQAVDLMTPRHEMVILDASDSWEVNLRKMADAGHTYFPVFKDDPGNVIGLVSIKTLCEQLAVGKTPDLTQALVPPLFVPEKTSALKILDRFRANQSHMALVLDEHGAIEGIISINDLLSGIVGEIPEIGEDAEEPDVVQREDGTWLVDGGMSATDLRDKLRLKKLPGDDGSYTTVGGMMMARLGRIPRAGDHFKWRGFRFEVVDMDRHRVDKILVARLPKDKDKDKDAPKSAGPVKRRGPPKAKTAKDVVKPAAAPKAP